MKKYRWNYKKFFKNIGMAAVVAAFSIAFDYALFIAFFGEVLH